MQTTEDSDLVIEGLVIVDRDGFYEGGETDGEFASGDLDAGVGEGAAISGTWPGEVRPQVFTHSAVKSDNLQADRAMVG